MNMPTDADRKAWPVWTVRIPAILGGLVAAFLGSIGWLGTGFGVITSCTDHFSCVIDTCAPCAAANHWIDAGGIGQWILVVAAGVLLVLGEKRPYWRSPLVVASVFILPSSIAWISISTGQAMHSF